MMMFHFINRRRTFELLFYFSVIGDYDLPSFQCNGCTYGFNLDWASTNLEKIFLQPKPKPKPTIMPVSTVQPPVMATVPPAPAANAYNSNYYNNSNYYDTTM